MKITKTLNYKIRLLVKCSVIIIIFSFVNLVHSYEKGTTEEAFKNNSKVESKKVTEIKPNKIKVNSQGWHIIEYSGRSYVTFYEIKKFYGFSKLSIWGGKIRLSGLGLNFIAKVGSQEIIINNIKFILSYPTVNSSQGHLLSVIDLVKLFNPIIRPSKINYSKPPKAVVIDPGHGGRDSGAIGILGKGASEKHFTMKIAKLVKNELNKLGFYVKMTRERDNYVELTERVRKTNATRDSIFISIHCNSNRNSSPNGIETFTMTPQGTKSTFESTSSRDLSKYEGNLQDSQNIILATAVHSALIGKLKTYDRGIRRARFKVLRGAKRPAILVECGFLTNRTDASKISNPLYQLSIAQSIAIGVRNYHKTLSLAIKNKTGKDEEKILKFADAFKIQKTKDTIKN